MAEIKNLLHKQQWAGEFFAPNAYEKRFQGKIEYSAEEGVILAYRLIDDQYVNTKLIYGILEDGRKCTLIGDFNSFDAGFSYHNGLKTNPGRTQFDYLIVGDHISLEVTFSDIAFSFTNMHEFFSPKGWSDMVKFSDKPLYVSSTSFGKITVSNNGSSFIPLHEDITKHIYSKDGEALDALQKAIDTVSTEYPKAHFLLKKDLSYMMSIHHNVAVNAGSLLKYVFRIADLFSLLIYSPVGVENIALLGTNSIVLEVYPTNMTTKDILERRNEEYFHYNLPLTSKSINLENLIGKWLDKDSQYAGVVSSIQNMTYLNTLHKIHGEIILFATQLESISHPAKQLKQKYNYPFNTYAHLLLKERAENIFKKVGMLNLGDSISGLRNEIAHVGKSQSLLKQLTPRDLIKIIHCMRLVIISYLFNELGVDKEAIEDYQLKLISTLNL